MNLKTEPDGVQHLLMCQIFLLDWFWINDSLSLVWKAINDAMIPKSHLTVKDFLFQLFSANGEIEARHFLHVPQ